MGAGNVTFRIFLAKGTAITVMSHDLGVLFEERRVDATSGYTSDCHGPNCTSMIGIPSGYDKCFRSADAVSFDEILTRQLDRGFYGFASAAHKPYIIQPFGSYACDFFGRFFQCSATPSRSVGKFYSFQLLGYCVDNFRNTMA